LANKQVTQGRLEEAMASLHKLRNTGGTYQQATVAAHR
jgi:hypothetical protein